MRGKHFEGGAAVFRRNHGEAAAPELSRHQPSHRLIVLGEQNHAFAHDRRDVRRHRHRQRISGGLSQNREVHAERAALARRAINHHVPAVLAHDGVDHREAEARALSGLLGGEERLEHLLAHLGRHADARITDQQHDVRTGNDVDVLRAELDIGGLDVQRAAEGHRVAGIYREVHHHLPDLGGVAADLLQVAGQREFEPDLRSDQAPHQILHVRNGDVQVDGLRHRRLPPAERQQLLGQTRGALGRTADLAGGAQLFRALRQDLDQLVAVTKQHRDQVVEIVRDAGGQPADCFHLLRLAQLVLEPGALAQVTGNRVDAHHLTVADQHAAVDVDRNANPLARY